MPKVSCDLCDSEELDRVINKDDKKIHYHCKKCRHEWVVTIEDLELMELVKSMEEER